MSDKSSRWKRYGASKLPRFNDSEEIWADNLKVDKTDPAAMMALRKWLWLQTHKSTASNK
jgi:hypothetical protein